MWPFAATSGSCTGFSANLATVPAHFTAEFVTPFAFKCPIQPSATSRDRPVKNPRRMHRAVCINPPLVGGVTRPPPPPPPPYCPDGLRLQSHQRWNISLPNFWYLLKHKFCIWCAKIQKFRRIFFSYGHFLTSLHAISSPKVANVWEFSKGTVFNGTAHNTVRQ